MSDEKVLTKKIAQQFLADEDSVDLSEFTAIKDDAAEVLATMDYLGGPRKDGPDLNGLLSLSSNAASHLARLNETLFLGECSDISCKAIQLLSDHKYDLYLGVKSLSDVSANHLSTKPGFLCLEDLDSLSASAAKLLAKHPHLYADIDRWPNDAADAFAVSATMLTMEIAERFLADEDSVDLTAFKGIEEQAAKRLARYLGGLHLDGLMTISDLSAEYLGNAFFGTSLSFGQVEHVSDAALASLSKFEGDLSFGSLAALSDVAAESLSRRRGALDVSGLTSLTGEVAEHLANHRGDLRLDGLEILSDAAADSLSRHEGFLSLDALKNLSEAAAISISKCRWGLDVQVSSISANSGLKVAEELLKHPSLATQPIDGSRFTILLQARATEVDELWELRDLNIADAYSEFFYDDEVYGNEWQRCFNFLKTAGRRTVWEISSDTLWVSDTETSRYIFYFLGSPAEVENRILSGIDCLSDEAAQLLSQYEGDLQLNRITEISNVAAACLSQHAFLLSLGSVRSLSDEAAVSLSKHEGPLFLTVDNLPESAAAILRKHPSFADED